MTLPPRGIDYISDPTYTATVGTVFDITSIKDDDADNGETFNLSLADGTWSNDAAYDTVDYKGSVTTTIFDDSTYTLKLFAVVGGETGNEDYKTANYMREGGSAHYVVLAVDGNDVPLTNQPVGTTVSVNATDNTATQGADYASGPYTVTVGIVFDIDSIDDTLADSGEDFNLSLVNGTWSNDAAYNTVNYKGNVTTTIYDEGTPDSAYTLQLFAVSDGEYTDANYVMEGHSADYVVLAVDATGIPLTDQPNGTVEINITGGTATQGVDYESGPYTATIGTEFNIDTYVDPYNDTSPEGDETFSLTIADGTWNYDGDYETITYKGDVVTTTITDDDTSILLKSSETNILLGGDEDDTLSGGTGNDSIYGGAGDDSLDGRFRQ